MTKDIRNAVVTMIVLALGASVVAAQGGRGRGRGMGRQGGRWATMSQEDLKTVNDLHQKIRVAQWELYGLQQSDADEKKIEQKTKQVENLRAELHKVMEETRPENCPGLNPDGVGRGPVVGRGWAGGRGRGGGQGVGFGRGAGFGRGGGRGLGGGWRWGTPPPTAPATQ